MNGNTDLAQICIPNRLKNIDKELDRCIEKREKEKHKQQKERGRKFRQDKKEAKHLFEKYGEKLIERLLNNPRNMYTRSELKKQIKSIATWQPARFIKMMEKEKRN